MTRQERLTYRKVMYHTFTLQGRVIILCCVRNSNSSIGDTNHYVGIAIMNPDDKRDDQLGRKIAKDRAEYVIKNKKTKHRFCLYSSSLRAGLMLAYLKECEDIIREEPSKYIKSLQK